MVAGPEGERLADALDALGVGRDLDVAGQALERVPAPYGADHPRADLLRHKTFQARWMSDPADLATVTSAALVDCCAGHLGACRDVHLLLVENLV